jgi:hypothetical protein
MEETNKYGEVFVVPITNFNRFPYRNSSSDVKWLAPQDQECSAFVSLTEEIEKFNSYVKVIR